jgi:hypothetical protein
MGGGQLLDGVGALWAVDVQDIEQVATGEADVGPGVAGPPGHHPGPIGRRLLDPVGDQAAQGVLADLAAARIPTRAAGPCHRRLGITGNRLETAWVGEG